MKFFGRIKIISLLSLLFISAACAKANYVEAAENGNTRKGSGDLSQCPISFEFKSLCVDWRWESIGNSQDTGSILFKVYRQSFIDKFPIVEDLEFNPSLVLWMASMGHGSSKTSIEKLDVGIYRASNVYFVMPGEWQLKFRIYNGEGSFEDGIAEVIVD